jgi:hypothetical protein
VSDFNQFRNFLTDFRKIIKYKLHENLSTGSGVVPCGQTDGRTDMAKLTVAFRNFTKVPNKAVSGVSPVHECILGKPTAAALRSV